jgi:RNA 3'-terminal phosphate cyclase (ATP)
MLEIDGSHGEGGGQVLRTSLALSTLTRQPVKIVSVRGRRSKPGLQPQHLRAVDAAAAISHAQVNGAALHSTTLEFWPGELRSGRYKFDIGTAGSTSLVLQTIFLPLSLAGSASTVIITGGTHVPHAPCYHYLEMQWLATLKRMGFNAALSMEAAGFYPLGGGRITATIRPVEAIYPLQPSRPGVQRSIQGLSAVANLDISIADRQKRQALGRLLRDYPNTHIKVVSLPAHSKGTLVLLQTVPASDDENPAPGSCSQSLGERGKPAERVADEAVDALLAFLQGDADLDQYLADQLLLPLAFAGGFSRFCTAAVTQHLLTNAWVIQEFTQARIEIDGEIGQPGWVSIQPHPGGFTGIGGS